MSTLHNLDHEQIPLSVTTPDVVQSKIGRSAMFYSATLVTPAMCMRLVNIGSQCLVANVDSRGKPFDVAKTYRLVLPAGIPAAAFWSTTVYDNQTRSMPRTPQRFPRAGSQNYPTPAASPDADGSMTIYFGPQRPDTEMPDKERKLQPN